MLPLAAFATGALAAGFLVCTDALRGNNEQFLQLARTELERVRPATQSDRAQKESAIDALLTPSRDGLAKYEAKLHRAVGSLERRVLPAARKFENLQTAGPKAIAVLESIDVTPAVLNAPELRLPAPEHADRASLA